jgi:LMBR1 domain-containing protein 1
LRGFPKSLSYFNFKQVASLSLAAWNVFLLPLDVANQKGLFDPNAGGIPMDKLTLGFYATSVILVLVVMPFTSYYYEGEDAEDDSDSKAYIS